MIDFFFFLLRKHGYELNVRMHQSCISVMLLIELSSLPNKISSIAYYYFV